MTLSLLKEEIINDMRPDGLLPVLRDNMIKTTVEFYLLYVEKISFWSADERRLIKALDAITYYDKDAVYILRRPEDEGGLNEVEQFDDYISYFVGTNLTRSHIFACDFITTLKARNWSIDQRPWSSMKEYLRCILPPWVAYQICRVNYIKPRSIWCFIGMIQFPFICLFNLFRDKGDVSGRLLLWQLHTARPSITTRLWNKLTSWLYRDKKWIITAFRTYYSQYPKIVKYAEEVVK